MPSTLRTPCERHKGGLFGAWRDVGSKVNLQQAPTGGWLLPTLADGTDGTTAALTPVSNLLSQHCAGKVVAALFNVMGSPVTLIHIRCAVS